MAGIIALLPALFRAPRQTNAVLSIALPFLMLFLATVFVSHSAIPSSEDTVRVALITTYSLDSNPSEKIRTEFTRALEDPFLELVVFPENLHTDAILSSVSEERARSLSILSSVHAPANLENSRGTMRIMLRKATSTSALHEKQFLVPFGEYLPFSAGALLNILFPIPSVKEAITAAQSSMRAGTKLSTFEVNGVRVGALLCSELVSPSLYAKLAREERADILVNLSSRTWFHESKFLHAKLLQIAKVQAVHAHRPLLVSTNNAPSYVLDANGRIISITLWGEESVRVIDVPFRNTLNTD
jgi:apolipoprotein N-acyltransferase